MKVADVAVLGRGAHLQVCSPLQTLHHSMGALHLEATCSMPEAWACAGWGWMVGCTAALMVGALELHGARGAVWKA